MSFTKKNLIILSLIFLVIIFFVFIFYFFRIESKNIGENPENKNVEANIVENTEPDKKDFIKDGELPVAGERGLNMLFFGDMMLDRHVGERIKKYGLEYIFKNISGTTTDLFSDYDLIGANLEGAVTDKGAHYRPEQAYDFAFAPLLIKQLQKYNFTYFNIANNHLSDQGERGIIETGKNLTDLGFLYSGCPDAVVGECSATTTVIRGLRIALLGFSQVYKIPDRSLATAAVSRAASSSDLVIVNIHWGREYEHEFTQTQQDWGRALVDAGAAAVIGHHPHVIQGLEVYKNRPIFYSLGNFIFDQYFSAATQEGLAVKLSGPGPLRRLELVPMISKDSQPRPMNEIEAAQFIARFISWSRLEQLQKEQLIKGGIDL